MVSVCGTDISIQKLPGERTGLSRWVGSSQGRGLHPQFGPVVQQVRIREQPTDRKWRKNLMSSSWAEASKNALSAMPGLS